MLQNKSIVEKYFLFRYNYFSIINQVHKDVFINLMPQNIS